jgi:hypothetical protein
MLVLLQNYGWEILTNDVHMSSISGIRIWLLEILHCLSESRMTRSAAVQAFKHYVNALSVFASIAYRTDTCIYVDALSVFASIAYRTDTCI